MTDNANDTSKDSNDDEQKHNLQGVAKGDASDDQADTVSGGAPDDGKE